MSNPFSTENLLGVSKGAMVGHSFNGNQYTGGQGGGEKEIKDRFMKDTKRMGSAGGSAIGIYANNDVKDKDFPNYLYSNYGHIRNVDELANALKTDKNVTIDYGVRYKTLLIIC